MFVTGAVLLLAMCQMWLFTPLFGPVRWLAVASVGAMLCLCVWGNLRATGTWVGQRVAISPGLRLVTGLTVPAIALLLLLGSELGTLQVKNHLAVRFIFLLLWAFTQQFMLQTVVLRETTALLGRRPGQFVTAAFFGLLHLPNPLLAPVTFLAALGWCWVYDRHPNLVPIALSHAAASLTLLIALGPNITGGMRVGYGYFLQQGSWL